MARICYTNRFIGDSLAAEARSRLRRPLFDDDHRRQATWWRMTSVVWREQIERRFPNQGRGNRAISILVRDRYDIN